MAVIHRPTNCILLAFALSFVQIFGSRTRSRLEQRKEGTNGTFPLQPVLFPVARGVPTTRVYLNVYDLNTACAVANKVLGKAGVGAWHIGLLVERVEYMFGDDGVISHPPGGADHIFSFQHHLGNSDRQPDEIQRLIFGLKPTWNGTYDLLEHNCGHFACTVAEMLGFDCPPWATRLAGAGASVRGVSDVVGAVAGKLLHSVSKSSKSSKSKGPRFRPGEPVLYDGYNAIVLMPDVKIMGDDRNFCLIEILYPYTAIQRTVYEDVLVPAPPPRCAM